MMSKQKMTAAEALEVALEATTSKKWFEAHREIIERLRSLGFVILPIEPDDAAIEKMAELISEYISGADRAGGLHKECAWAAYAVIARAGAEER